MFGQKLMHFMLSKTKWQIAGLQMGTVDVGIHVQRSHDKMVDSDWLSSRQLSHDQIENSDWLSNGHATK